MGDTPTPDTAWAGRARAAAIGVRAHGHAWAADLLNEAADMATAHRAQMALVEEERDRLEAEVERDRIERDRLHAARRTAEAEADRQAVLARQRAGELEPVVVVTAAADPVLVEVAEERLRQNALWGEQNHPDIAPDITGALAAMDLPHRAHYVARGYFMPTADEARERCDTRLRDGQGAWADIAVEELAEALEAAAVGTDLDVRDEVLQLAAVAVAWAQAIDRRHAAQTTTTEETTTP